MAKNGSTAVSNYGRKSFMKLGTGVPGAQCLTRQVFSGSVKKIILKFFDEIVFEDV